MEVRYQLRYSPLITGGTHHTSRCRYRRPCQASTDQAQLASVLTPSPAPQEEQPGGAQPQRGAGDRPPLGPTAVTDHR